MLQIPQVNPASGSSNKPPNEDWQKTLAQLGHVKKLGYVPWVANKRFEISKFKFKFPRARTYEIIGLVLGCIEAKFCK